MGFKSWYKRRYARQLGKELSESGHPMMEWLKAHKTEVGTVFMAVYGWAVYKGCPPLVGYDLTQYVSCGTLNSLISLIGGALLGGGVLKSDQFHRDKQEAAKIDKVIDQVVDRVEEPSKEDKIDE